MIRTGIAASLLSVLACTAFAEEARRPNIVLILADDLGRECLGCYGGESYQTSAPRSVGRVGDAVRDLLRHASLCDDARSSSSRRRTARTMSEKPRHSG